MKTNLIILLLAIVSFQGIAQKTTQDFFEELNAPNGGGFWSLKSNSQGELFISDRGLHRSIDNGNTWDSIKFPYYVGDIAISDNDDIFIGCTWGMYYSNDNGASFSFLTPESETRNILITSNNDIIFGNHGQLYKMDYYGNKIINTLSTIQFIDVKEIVEHPAGFLMTAFSTIHPEIEWHFIHRSFDNGTTWEPTDLVDRVVYGLAFNSLGDIYSGQMREYEYGLYKSVDLATTWEFILEDWLIHKIYITPDDDIYLGISMNYSPYGGVLRSTNGGETWETLLSGYYIIDHFTISNNWRLFAGGYSTRLFRSNQPVWDSTYRVRMTIEPENAGTVAGVGSYYHGTNATLTAVPSANYQFEGWTVNRKTNASDSILDLEMLRPMYVTAHFTKIVAVNEIPDNDFKIYPNPASDFVTINTNRTENCVLELYNASGVRVYQSDVVSNTTKINTTNYETGVYYLRLVKEGEVLETTMLVVE